MFVLLIERNAASGMRPEVESVEEQRYYEFSNALSKQDVLVLVQDTLEDTEGKGADPAPYHDRHHGECD